MAYPGLAVMSQNILSTATIMAGYKYDVQNDNGATFFNVNFMGWYPVLETNIEYGNKSFHDYQVEITGHNAGQLAAENPVYKKYNWQQLDMDARLTLPLDLSRGKYARELKHGLALGMGNRFAMDTLAYLTRGLFQTVQAGLYFNQELVKSRQDLIPDLGFGFDVSYARRQKGLKTIGSSFSAEHWLYLPGFIKNHGIKLYQGYQQNREDVYLFENKVKMARGYKMFFNQQIYTLGADYVMPLFYPEFSLGRFLYCQRINAGVFYDRSYIHELDTPGTQGNFDYFLHSAGLELTSDLNLFRFFMPLKIGVGVNYLFNKTFDLDFIMGARFSVY